jgi:hypothetical protein
MAGLLYLGLFMDSMLPVKGAILAQFQLFLGIAPVFLGGIVLPLTFRALKRHQLNNLLLTSHIYLLLCLFSQL